MLTSLSVDSRTGLTQRLPFRFPHLETHLHRNTPVATVGPSSGRGPISFPCSFPRPATHSQDAPVTPPDRGSPAHPIPTAPDLRPVNLRKSPPPSPALQQDFQKLAQTGDFVPPVSQTQRRGFQDPTAKPFHGVQTQTVTKATKRLQGAQTLAASNTVIFPAALSVSCVQIREQSWGWERLDAKVFTQTVNCTNTPVLGCEYEAQQAAALRVCKVQPSLSLPRIISHTLRTILFPEVLQPISSHVMSFPAL